MFILNLDIHLRQHTQERRFNWTKRHLDFGMTGPMISGNKLHRM
ncbi:Os05g0132400 [Oryza sativa Japonica Group]|uniref:Os05g0132400 protein n=1 Tax=Oryza sativa subsp. japonica TaxID=39947 RepID=Q0DL01_ORYSJ|nr:Os05g0132400 [Oryza sativa Japonica Group]|eukprot:NP_001054558.1 Os05g0132400 [Oryza sativa Japonica Group]